MERYNVRTKKGLFVLDVSNCRYKHLTKVLCKKYGTLSEMSRELGYCTTAIKSVLQGNSQPKKDFIDTLISATGETYEQIFCEDYR